MSIFSINRLFLLAIGGLFFTLQAQAAKIEFYVANYGYGPQGIPVLAGEESVSPSDMKSIPVNTQSDGTLVYSKHYHSHWRKTVHHTKTIVIYNPVSQQAICGVQAEIVIKEGFFGNVDVNGGAGAKISSSSGKTYGYCNPPQKVIDGDTEKVYVTAEAFPPSGSSSSDSSSALDTSSDTSPDIDTDSDD